MANPKLSQDVLERMSEVASLTKLAIGNRTKVAFTNESGLSISFISRLVNCNLPGIPNINSLGKIARASEGRVTYEQLLIAAGYEVYDSDIELSKMFETNETKPTCIISDDVGEICKEIGELIEVSGKTIPTAIVLAKKLSTLTTLQQVFQNQNNIVIQYALMLD